MRRWWRTLRIGEWGVQLILLWLAAVAYFPVAGVAAAAYLTHLARVSLWTALLVCGGYLINDVHDRVQDRGKRPRDSLAQRRPRLVYGMGLGSLAAGMTSIVLSAPGSAIVTVAAVQAAGGLAYSVPGIRLKERGVWGVVTAATLQRIPSFLMFVMPFPARPAATAAMLAWFLVVGLIFIVEHQLSDFRHDRSAGVRTWATDHGQLVARQALHRLYRLFTMVNWATAAAMFAAAPGLRGALSGALLFGLGTLFRFLIKRR